MSNAFSSLHYQVTITGIIVEPNQKKPFVTQLVACVSNKKAMVAKRMDARKPTIIYKYDKLRVNFFDNMRWRMNYNY